MIVKVRAPATSANLGPAFDCAGMALELWNELEVSEAEGALVEVEGEGVSETPRDASHLGLRAFALIAPVEGKRFRFLNRIPFARGLGSSSATIALGLVAACLWEGVEPDPAELLPLALRLESHADNLAACLYGGVTLSWEEEGSWYGRRVADSLPLAAIAVVPEHSVETVVARAGLPDVVTHVDAAFSGGRAALLGAGLASGDADLLAAAFHDRLHEPYRSPAAPILAQLQEEPACGSVGVTLSGSGPTVIVWARHEDSSACAEELGKRFPDCKVREAALATCGTGAT
ncbi:MAG: homoserine kinase [Gaiellaceae bacterium]